MANVASPFICYWNILVLIYWLFPSKINLNLHFLFPAKLFPVGVPMTMLVVIALYKGQNSVSVQTHYIILCFSSSSSTSPWLAKLSWVQYYVGPDDFIVCGIYTIADQIVSLLSSKSAQQWLQFKFSMNELTFKLFDHVATVADLGFWKGGSSVHVTCRIKHAKCAR